jgi:NADH:ubiquinone oxidoreductase subunit K
VSPTRDQARFGSTGIASGQGRMKVLLTAVGWVLGAWLLAAAAVLVLAFTAGPSVAAGERAAVIAFVLDGVLWLAATLGFWLSSRSLPRTSRIVATLGVCAVAAAGLAVAFGLTLLVLNR